MRRAVLAGVLLLVVGGTANAGPLGRRSDCDECPREPRFPRLAGLTGTPSYVTNPGPFADRPILRNAVRFGLFALYLGNDAMDWTAFGVPRAIRAGRVVLYGSPTPGRPGATALYIASPALLRAFEFVRARRNGTGGNDGVYYGAPVYEGTGYYHDGPVWGAPAPGCAGCEQ